MASGAYFYPRSPCGERLNAHLYYHSRGLFLSTLSLRRATIDSSRAASFQHHFYPRSPCGERLSLDVLAVSALPISIHALLAESDLRVVDGSKSSIEISIHALLAESDLMLIFTTTAEGYFYPRSPCGERRESRQPCAHPTKDFYPRSPCGERLFKLKIVCKAFRFLSTLSLRRATAL